ncbi:MAG TPA: single-stranded-DNA-specific exonuclease RecJ [Porticoccaceae bacterium]|nr:single-stranded-DNA-specific exonuclease RecJ [Porticoccaceae bacterium]HCO60374.1 single-stranded-DNA-specific exonuclease RecJ [Porticoccaceae bacterium]
MKGLGGDQQTDQALCFQSDGPGVPSLGLRESDPGLCDFDESVPVLLQRIYAGRGIRSQDQLKLSLDELPAPGQLRGLDQALALLVEAFEAGQKILIVGDFDADGATSTALSLLALKAMGHKTVEFLVPDRFRYGYGLTPEIVELAAQREPDLLITVDNGISSHAGVEAARALGIKVLITDHHLPAAELPSAEAIVNPHQPDCAFPSKNLAGVGVIFYVLSALRGRLRERGWFASKNIHEPNMAQWLDLVALGTVADVVTLDQSNRILVNQGLARIRSGRTRPGIQALLELANREPVQLVAADLGFALGPRLNAAGRLDDMSLGIHCLLTDDPLEARSLAGRLDELNRDRRVIEADMKREAMALINDLRLDEESMPWGLCLLDEQWHQGVVGLLASRIKDRFHRPVIAFAGAGQIGGGGHQGEGAELKGSARSIPGLHIRDVLDTVAAHNPGMITRFGGHAMAAGLSLPKDNFAAFAVAFDNVVRQVLSPEELQATLLVDGQLEKAELNLAMAEQLRQGGPWGQGFPEPLFYGEFKIIERRVVGEMHLKLMLSPPQNPEHLLDAIAFGVVEDYDVDQLPELLPLAYRLDVNEFRNRRSVQLRVERILLPTLAAAPV